MPTDTVALGHSTEINSISIFMYYEFMKILYIYIHIFNLINLGNLIYLIIVCQKLYQNKKLHNANVSTVITGGQKFQFVSKPKVREFVIEKKVSLLIYYKFSQIKFRKKYFRIKFLCTAISQCTMYM